MYTLESVDGAKLPVPYFNEGDGSSNGDLIITAGWFTLQVDNSFIDTLTLVASIPGSDVTQPYSTRTDGTYTLAGSRLTLTPMDCCRFSSLVAGSLEAGNLGTYVSFRADGKLFLYRKMP
jgi:hypothetical protein